MNDDAPIRFSGKTVSIPINADVRSYRIACVNADGSFWIARRFFARNDEAANAYVSEHFGRRECYVLDASGRNINGGAA